MLLLRELLRLHRLLWPKVLVQGLCALAHLLWLQLLVHWLHLGFTGICLASLISSLSGFLVLSALLCTAHAVRPASLLPCSRKDLAWARVKEVLASGVPGALWSFLESGPFALLPLVLVALGPLPLAGHALLAALAGLIYVLPFGCVSAAPQLISSAVVSGEPGLAKSFLAESLVAATGASALGVGLCFTLSSRLSALLTPDPELGSLVEACLGFMLLSLVFDSVHAGLQAGLKGLEKHKAAALSSLLWAWCFFAPLGGGVAVFVARELWAVWAFLAATNFCLALTAFLVLARYDWAKETQLLGSLRLNEEPLLPPAPL